MLLQAVQKNRKEALSGSNEIGARVPPSLPSFADWFPQRILSHVTCSAFPRNSPVVAGGGDVVRQDVFDDLASALWAQFVSSRRRVEGPATEFGEDTANGAPRFRHTDPKLEGISPVERAHSSSVPPLSAVLQAGGVLARLCPNRFLSDA
jgi:hypothetical protein